MVQVWTDLHREELLADWELAKEGTEPFRIDHYVMINPLQPRFEGAGFHATGFVLMCATRQEDKQQSHLSARNGQSTCIDRRALRTCSLPPSSFVGSKIFGRKHLVASHRVTGPQFIRLHISPQRWQRHL